MQAEHSSLYPPSGGLTCYCLTVDIDVPSGFGGVGSYVQIENWVLGNPCFNMSIQVQRKRESDSGLTTGCGVGGA